MTKAATLLEEINKRERCAQHIPKVLVVALLKVLCLEAQQVPLHTSARVGDIDSTRSPFPIRHGVDVQSIICGVLLPIDWIDDDPELSQVSDIAIHLDQHTDDQDAWHELFNLIDRLS